MTIRGDLTLFTLSINDGEVSATEYATVKNPHDEVFEATTLTSLVAVDDELYAMLYLDKMSSIVRLERVDATSFTFEPLHCVFPHMLTGLAPVNNPPSKGNRLHNPITSLLLGVNNKNELVKVNLATYDVTVLAQLPYKVLTIESINGGI
mgnify:CR=1 FL=1